MEITWDDFEKIDIRCGTVTEAKVFEKARKPAYQLWIDFGELGIRRSSAQITVHYQPVELIGRFMSECLVLGVYDTDGSVVLLKADKAMENGSRIG
jgi:tRNA-binding protein